MWRFIKEILLSIIINAVILRVLNYYKFGLSIVLLAGTTPGLQWVDQMMSGGDLRGLRMYLILGTIFWIVNFLLRRILHIVSWPLKLFTFGIISIIINVGVLYLFQWIINTNYGDLVQVVISQDYVKAFVLSVVITAAYWLLSKILK